MRVLIIGAGGFSAEVVDLLATLGHQVVGYYDASPPAERGYGAGAPPIGDSLDGWEADAAAWAIGDCAAREKLASDVSSRFEMPRFIHPSAIVSPSALLGEGTILMENAVVKANVRIGAHCILNVGCCVGHDAEVGAFVHLAPGVQMGGGSRVGTGVFCGTNATVLPYKSVGDWSICGAGCVVTKDLPEGWVAVGSPARAIREVGR